jgi:hypothetical protein
MESRYIQLTNIIRDYLGPATERFLNRQIEFYLNKSTKELTVEEITRLSVGIQNALRLLTRDEAIINEATRRIQGVAKHL